MAFFDGKTNGTATGACNNCSLRAALNSSTTAQICDTSFLQRTSLITFLQNAARVSLSEGPARLLNSVRVTKVTSRTREHFFSKNSSTGWEENLFCWQAITVRDYGLVQGLKFPAEAAPAIDLSEDLVVVKPTKTQPPPAPPPPKKESGITKNDPLQLLNNSSFWKRHSWVLIFPEIPKMNPKIIHHFFLTPMR